jgi:hypothetical protein
MSADLDYLYAHHAVGLCPEERCVTARANLAALVASVGRLLESGGMDTFSGEADMALLDLRTALQAALVEPSAATPGPLPCGYRFKGGGECLTFAFHPVHHGQWPGREETHEHVPLERRKADRRAALQGRVASREGSGT